MSTSNNDSNGSPRHAGDVPGAGNANAELADAHFTRRVTAELDTAVEAIDVSTASRLSSARRAALAQAPGKRNVGTFGMPWATVAAGLAASLVVVLLWFEAPENSVDTIVTDSASTTLESLPILSSSDDLEFYQSVDFLVWMEQNSG